MAATRVLVEHGNAINKLMNMFKHMMLAWSELQSKPVTQRLRMLYIDELAGFRPASACMARFLALW
jgi:hypothetical protein